MFLFWWWWAHKRWWSSSSCQTRCYCGPFLGILRNPLFAALLVVTVVCNVNVSSVCLQFLLRGERRVIAPLHLQDTRKSCSEWGCWLFLLVCKIKCMYIHILHAYTYMDVYNKKSKWVFLSKKSSSPGQYITFFCWNELTNLIKYI